MHVAGRKHLLRERDLDLVVSRVDRQIVLIHTARLVGPARIEIGAREQQQCRARLGIAPQDGPKVGDRRIGVRRGKIELRPDHKRVGPAFICRQNLVDELACCGGVGPCQRVARERDPRGQAIRLGSRLLDDRVQDRLALVGTVRPDVKIRQRQPVCDLVRLGGHKRLKLSLGRRYALALGEIADQRALEIDLPGRLVRECPQDRLSLIDPPVVRQKIDQHSTIGRIVLPNLDELTQHGLDAGVVVVARQQLQFHQPQSVIPGVEGDAVLHDVKRRVYVAAPRVDAGQHRDCAHIRRIEGLRAICVRRRLRQAVSPELDRRAQCQSPRIVGRTLKNTLRTLHRPSDVIRRQRDPPDLQQCGHVAGHLLQNLGVLRKRCRKVAFVLGDQAHVEQRLGREGIDLERGAKLKRRFEPLALRVIGLSPLDRGRLFLLRVAAGHHSGERQQGKPTPPGRKATLTHFHQRFPSPRRTHIFVLFVRQM